MILCQSRVGCWQGIRLIVTLHEYYTKGCDWSGWNCLSFRRDTFLSRIGFPLCLSFCTDNRLTVFMSTNNFEVILYKAYDQHFSTD